MRLRNLCAVLVLGGCSLTGLAQMGMMPKGPTLGTAVSPAQAEDELLNLFEHEFMGVAKTMPADKYSFAPSAANFVPSQGSRYEGVRTFAQEVAHVTQANYFFGSAILGEKPPAKAQQVGKLTSKDELLKAAAQSFEYAHKAVASITPENAFVAVKGVDGLHTRAVIASFIAAHGFDHYGQMVEYLRMNGLVPPGSK